jgi:hypothetical protein
MSAFPHSDNPLVVRTDFSDDEAWARVRAAIEAPVGDFQANVTFVDDREYEGLTVERLPEFLPETFNDTFIFLVDRETLTGSDNPVLTIDVFHEVGRFFRVVPSEMWIVENNLSLANLDWEDFANHVDADGVFRAFPE